jgi:hypothetical protein
MSENTESSPLPDGEPDAGTALSQDSFSLGETGEALDTAAPSTDVGQSEVIVGEIPDAHEITRLVWTARCTFPPHGLLGTFPDREGAELKKREHLLSKHGRRK